MNSSNCLRTLIFILSFAVLGQTYGMQPGTIQDQKGLATIARYSNAFNLVRQMDQTIFPSGKVRSVPLKKAKHIFGNFMVLANQYLPEYFNTAHPKVIQFYLTVIKRLNEHSSPKKIEESWVQIFDDESGTLTELFNEFLSKPPRAKNMQAGTIQTQRGFQLVRLYDKALTSIDELDRKTFLPGSVRSTSLTQAQSLVNQFIVLANQQLPEYFSTSHADVVAFYQEVVRLLQRRSSPKQWGEVWVNTFSDNKGELEKLFKEFLDEKHDKVMGLLTTLHKSSGESRVSMDGISGT